MKIPGDLPFWPRMFFVFLAVVGVGVIIDKVMSLPPDFGIFSWDFLALSVLIYGDYVVVRHMVFGNFNTPLSGRKGQS